MSFLVLESDSRLERKGCVGCEFDGFYTERFECAFVEVESGIFWIMEECSYLCLFFVFVGIIYGYSICFGEGFAAFAI